MDTEKPKIKEFRFNYEKYESSGVTVEEMNENIKLLQSKTTNTFTAVLLAIRFLGIMVCYWVRRGLIEEQERIEKQRYEQNRTIANSGTIAEDDLD
jgi:hypothetical protein